MERKCISADYQEADFIVGERAQQIDKVRVHH
jgi:hypothetical protein